MSKKAEHEIEYFLYESLSEAEKILFEIATKGDDITLQCRPSIMRRAFDEGSRIANDVKRKKERLMPHD